MSTILLIEDEPAIADNVVYALETEGFETEWAQLGEQGLELLREREIALVILDVGLPDGNGFEFCKRIREFSDVPVIFLTARSDEVDRVVGLEIGADDYVVKPFSPRELSARVKVVLRRVQAARPADAVISEKPDLGFRFTLDRAANRVRYGDAPLNLTKLEFMILTLLMESPGRVFSRSQIMERVWEQPGMSQERAVDTHIKSLRAKLRDVSPDRDPIKTHRGFGYSLQGVVSEL
jgi:two-component system catabolic regulation response regulator CreB